MQEVSAAIDEAMGELVDITPARAQKVNFPPVADPSKTVTVVATFMNKAKTVIMGNEGRMGGHSLSPLVETSEPVFSFGYGVLPFPLAQGFRITRRCNGVVYEVTNLKDDSVSRIVVNVVQLGRPSAGED
jgi:hypothetical protein